MKLEVGKKYKVVGDPYLPSISLWEHQTGNKSEKSAMAWFMEGFEELTNLTIKGYTIEITRFDEEDNGCWFKLFDEDGTEVKNRFIPETEEFWLKKGEIEKTVKEV